MGDDDGEARDRDEPALLYFFSVPNAVLLVFSNSRIGLQSISSSGEEEGTQGRRTT